MESKLFDMDTLRVPNRSPIPTSKSNDFLRLSDDIWGARGPHFRPILGGFPGVRAGLQKHIFGSPLKRPPPLPCPQRPFYFRPPSIGVFKRSLLSSTPVRKRLPPTCADGLRGLRGRRGRLGSEGPSSGKNDHF